MEPLVVGISGASGAVYGHRLVSTLIRKRRKVHFLLTKSALKVFRDEMGIDLGTELPLSRARLSALFGKDAPRFVLAEGLDDWDSPLASGSYRTGPMVIIPCSMGTLAAVATGSSRTLLERRADVTLKEGGRLILVPRETPLNRIHLRHLLAVSEMGALIVPAMPGFYHQPKTVDDLVNFVVGKILDLLAIPHTLFRRWKG